MKKYAADQSDSLAFNGQNNSDKVAQYSTKYQKNPSPCPTNPDSINYGRGPTKGMSGEMAGPNSAAGGKINGGAQVPAVMKSNYGRGPTKGLPK